MRWLKRNLSTIILVAILFAGLCLLLYPSFSDYWNSFHQSRAIANYAEYVANIKDDKYMEIWNQAVAYNEAMDKNFLHLNLSEEEIEKYNATLDITGTGIMGYIEIQNIDCYLPIYHGTSDEVLQIAAGHIAGTALPIGGASTHCVISGHRGLPSARLFTDIDQLAEGDTFIIRVLDETLTYEVDQILIVLPEEVDALQVEPEQDLCTLVTCTPYGVNSHRLLVRGHRIPNINTSQIRVTADAQQIEPIFVAPMVAVPILFILLIWLIISTRKKKK